MQRQLVIRVDSVEAFLAGTGVFQRLHERFGFFIRVFGLDQGLVGVGRFLGRVGAQLLEFLPGGEQIDARRSDGGLVLALVAQPGQRLAFFHRIARADGDFINLSLDPNGQVGLLGLDQLAGGADELADAPILDGNRGWGRFLRSGLAGRGRLKTKISKITGRTDGS